MTQTTATKPARNGREREPIPPPPPAFEDEPSFNQPAARPELPFLTESELLARDFPEPGWFIPGMLPVGLVSSLIGPSGCGKTWLALYLMRCLSAGVQVFGNPALPARRTRCGYVDLEDEWVDIKARWLALEAGMGPRPAGFEPCAMLSSMGSVSILNPTIGKDGTVALSEWGERLADSIRARGLELVFVDSLSKAHSLPESDESMKHVIASFQRIARDTGSTFVLLHHAGWAPTGSKRPERGRGSSTIRDGVVAELFLTEGEDGAVALKLNKLKRGPRSLALPQMRIEAGEAGAVRLAFEEAGSPANMGDVRRRAIVATLEEAGSPVGFTALRDLVMASTGHGRTPVEEDIRRLAQAGKIVQDKERGPYRLP